MLEDQVSDIVGEAHKLESLLSPAMALLDEPLRPILLAGTALVVAGGAVLALDPGRPVGFRMLGVVLALVCAALFAGRDNAVRWIARDDTAPPLQATAVTLLAAAVATTLYVTLAGRVAGPGWGATVRAFVPAGLLLAFADVFVVMRRSALSRVVGHFPWWRWGQVFRFCSADGGADLMLVLELATL